MPFLTFPIKLLLGGVGTVGVAAGTVMITTSAVGNSSSEGQRVEETVELQSSQDSSNENTEENPFGYNPQNNGETEEEIRKRNVESDTPELIH